MKAVLHKFAILGTTSLATLSLACGRDTMQPSTLVPARLTLNRTVSAAALASLVLDSTPGRPASIRREFVDSLTVTVTGVEVHLRHFGRDSLGEPRDSLDRDDSLPPRLDSLRPPPDSLWPPPDSLRPPTGWPGRDGDSVEGGRGWGPGGPGSEGDRDDWGRRPMGCDSCPGTFALNVVSGAHIDLLHLPEEGQPGLVVASGSLPPGDYDRARLLVTDGVIWLNTPIVTPQGDTLPANTAIPVTFPSGELRVDVDFTVPEGGGDVPLVFDQDESFAHIVITGDGKVIMTPVMWCRRGRR
jgi:hypothetical protein